MLSISEAKDRAVERAIQTGVLPNIDLIHQIQKFEGAAPCFGRMERPCTHTECAGHSQCMALLATPRPSVAAH